MCNTGHIDHSCAADTRIDPAQAPARNASCMPPPSPPDRATAADPTAAACLGVTATSTDAASVEDTVRCSSAPRVDPSGTDTTETPMATVRAFPVSIRSTRSPGCSTRMSARSLLLTPMTTRSFGSDGHDRAARTRAEVTGSPARIGAVST